MIADAVAMLADAYRCDTRAVGAVADAFVMVADALAMVASAFALVIRYLAPMKRAIFGMLGIACGLGALHFLQGWLRVSSAIGCYGNARCLEYIQRGTDTHGDRQKTILLFGLTAFFVWSASSSRDDHHPPPR